MTLEEGEDSANSLESLRRVATDRFLNGDMEGAESLVRKGLATLARLAANAGLPPDAPPPRMLTVWVRSHHVLSKVLVE